MGYATDHASSAHGAASIRRMNVGDFRVCWPRDARAAPTSMLIRLEADGQAYGVDVADGQTLAALGVATYA